MTNRGFTTAERLHHTILTNRVALQPAATQSLVASHCPVCGSKTRQGVRSGSVLDLCYDRVCSWPGEVRLPELQAAVKAEMGMGGVA